MELKRAIHKYTQRFRGINTLISVVIVFAVTLMIVTAVTLWIVDFTSSQTARGQAVVKSSYSLYVGQLGSPENWWNRQWSFRKPIIITERSRRDLTDYTVKVVVDTASLISDGKMRSDGGDIRFVTADGQELPYWIESGLGTRETIIWVKVPYIPSGRSIVIYMYYGNPLAEPKSDPEQTFQYFIDFRKLEQEGRLGLVDHIPWPHGDFWTIEDDYTLRLGGRVSVYANFTTEMIRIRRDGTQILELYMKIENLTTTPGGNDAEYLIGFKNDLRNLPNWFTTWIRFGGTDPNEGHIGKVADKDYDNNAMGTWQLVYEIIDWFPYNYCEGGCDFKYMVFVSEGYCFNEERAYVLYRNVRIREYTSPEPKTSVGEEEVWPDWVVSVYVSNKGSADTSITGITINDRDITDFPEVILVRNRDTGEVYYCREAGINAFKEGVPIRAGETIVLEIEIWEEAFKHGQTIEVTIRTATGQEFYTMVELS